MKSAFCYHDFADKREKYVADVIPAIFTHAHRALPLWQAHTIPVANEDTLIRLHERMRELPYIGEDEAFELSKFCPEAKAIDVVQKVEDTLAEGGDCEDFAAVLLSALWAWGIPASLETAGDELDPFRHVRALAAVENRVFILDPRPHELGMDFNERWGSFDVIQTWNYVPHAEAV